MIFSFIIFFIFVVGFRRNYQKTSMALFPTSLLFTTLPLVVFGETVIYLNFALFVYFYAYSCLFKHLYFKDNPYRRCLYLALICVFLVVIGGTYRSSIANVANQAYLYLFPLFFYSLLRDKRNIELFTKYFVRVLFIITIYGIIEFIFHKNIWMYFLQEQTPFRLFVDHSNDFRFGYGRCNSFFHFPIPFGDVCAISFSFILYLYYKKNFLIPKKKIKQLLFLLLIGVVLANSRASLIALLIGMLHFPLKRKYYGVLLFSGLLFSFVVGGYVVKTYDSIFNESESSEVQGSSLEMRNTQLEISFNDFLNNPIFGGGYNRVHMVESLYREDGIAGAESIVFVLLMNEGLVGILAYIVIYLSLFMVFPKGCKKFAFVLSTSWVVAAVVSLTTGVTIIFPMILLIIIYKGQMLKLIQK